MFFTLIFIINFYFILSFAYKFKYSYLRSFINSCNAYYPLSPSLSSTWISKFRKMQIFLCFSKDLITLHGKSSFSTGCLQAYLIILTPLIRTLQLFFDLLQSFCCVHLKKTAQFESVFLSFKILIKNHCLK